MSKKYEVITRAIFDRSPIGSKIVVDEFIAKKYERMKYLTIVGEVKEKSAKKDDGETAKKPTTKKTVKKDDKK